MTKRTVVTKGRVVTTRLTEKDEVVTKRKGCIAKRGEVVRKRTS